MSQDSLHSLAAMVAAGDLRALAAALRGEPSLVRATTEDGHTLLHLACRAQQVAATALILGYRPDWNARGPGGRTPLHEAALRDGLATVPIIGMLLAAGAAAYLGDAHNVSVDDYARSAMTDGLAETLDLLRRAPGPPEGTPPI